MFHFRQYQKQLYSLAIFLDLVLDEVSRLGTLVWSQQPLCGTKSAVSWNVRGDRGRAGTSRAGTRAGTSRAGQKPAGREPAGQAPAGQKPARQAPAGQKPAGQVPAGQIPAGQKTSRAACEAQQLHNKCHSGGTRFVAHIRA